MTQDKPPLTDAELDQLGEDIFLGRAIQAPRVAPLLEAYRAARQLPSVPIGWRLVPAELTHEMYEAPREALPGIAKGELYQVWHFMLSAAPASPIAGGGGLEMGPDSSDLAVTGASVPSAPRDSLEREARSLWNERQEDCAKYGADISMPEIAVPVDVFILLLDACVALQMEARARNCGLLIADAAIAKARSPIVDETAKNSRADPLPERHSPQSPGNRGDEG